MKLLLLISILTLVPHAVAYDAERAKQNLAHESAECGAYFLLLSAAPGLDAATAKGLKAGFDSLLKISVGLTSAKLTEARFDLATQAMMRDLDGSWSNVSILNSKHGYKCSDLAKDPEARLRYWLAKKD